jgi:hypothetical protein
MKNSEMLEISKTRETVRISRVPETTRKKVKKFLNEGVMQLSF